MSLEQIHDQNQNFLGAKALLYLGEELVACVRDENTDSFPGWLDLAGGGREDNPNNTPESAFQTLQRETWEEVNLWIRPRHVTYARRYVSQIDPNRIGFFFVAQLPAKARRKIRIGEEGSGLEYFNSLSELLARPDLIPVLRRRTLDYAQHIGAAIPLDALAA